MTNINNTPYRYQAPSTQTSSQPRQLTGQKRPRIETSTHTAQQTSPAHQAINFDDTLDAIAKLVESPRHAPQAQQIAQPSPAYQAINFDDTLDAITKLVESPRHAPQAQAQAQAQQTAATDHSESTNILDLKEYLDSKYGNQPPKIFDLKGYLDRKYGKQSELASYFTVKQNP